MKRESFINDAFEEAIGSYNKTSKTKNSITYNSFLVVTIRILVLIYGELDIINPYNLGDSVTFFNNLGKYGMNKSDIALFEEEFLSYYEFEELNKKRNIKTKNPYFKNVLEYLIDMFVCKKKAMNIPFEEEETFLELIYTTHTKNPYRISYGYLMLGDNVYSEKYYYSHLNEIDVTREIKINKNIDANLNLEALKLMGINLSSLQGMSNEEIMQLKRNSYSYFEIDENDLNREEKLQNKVDLYKMHGKKLTTGNGYVDILLLMSIIVTSFSVIAIIVFSVV